MKSEKILRDFAEKSLQNNPKSIEKLELQSLSEEQVKVILELVGMDLREYKRIVDNYAVRHTHKKHGHESTEKPRGQVAVECEDFEKITEIIQKPDEQNAGGVSNIGRQTLVSSKELEKGIYFYVEEIRNKQKELAMQTLYIRKKKG